MRSGASRRGKDRISNGTKRRCDAPCVISCIAFPPSGILMADFRRPSPPVMLVCASMILTLALGIRHSFGLFLQPMSMDNGWGREVFGFAVALQNLLWGVTQPFTGMLADRFGAGRVLFAGGLLYALGLVLMANSTTALGPTLAGGVSLREALAEAFRHKGFWLLGVGYFACGFQVVFIGTHFPAFLMDQGLTARDGTICLSLIGLFNIFGSYLAGQLGGRFSKTYLLSGLYAARGVAIALLIAFPLTPMSAYLFAAAMGFLWLGTVPLTNGVVAGIFGVKHLAMLSGFVFFFHQLGSFFGGWLGGYLFDRTGSYQLVWLIAIGLSVISVVVNLPIDERPVKRAGEPVAA